MELLLPSFGLIAWTLSIVAVTMLICVVALKHLFRSNAVHGGEKLTWGLIICLLPAFGGLLYLVIGRKEFINTNQS